MDGELLVRKALTALIDPEKPYIYIYCIPVALLVTLGRPKLAILWVVAVTAIFFFL